MRSGEHLEVTRLLGSLQPMPVDASVAWRAGEFRRSHTAIGTAGYLIAACADVHGCELATLNVRHFPMFEGLEPPFTP